MQILNEQEVLNHIELRKNTQVQVVNYREVLWDQVGGVIVCYFEKTTKEITLLFIKEPDFWGVRMTRTELDDLKSILNLFTKGD